MSSPFHLTAKGYYDAGFLPFPLPYAAKSPPPKGVPNEIVYSEQRLNAWLDINERNNIGTIIPPGFMVIDVDESQEVVQRLERVHGTLPPTIGTYRGDPSRYHLWYATPIESWPGKLGDRIDVLSPHYRYEILPPSIHNKTHCPYQWILYRDGSFVPLHEHMPSLFEFGELPLGWSVLSRSLEYTGRERINVDAQLWLKANGKGSPCERMRALTRTAIGSITSSVAGGLHDAVVNGVWSILAAVTEGHQGAIAALNALYDTAMSIAMESGRRSHASAHAEWVRAVDGGVQKSASVHLRESDPCVLEDDEEVAGFFDAHGLRAIDLRDAVERSGELAVGPGKTIYRWDNGLWSPDGDAEISRRVAHLLGQRWRPGHAENVRQAIRCRIPRITEDTQDTEYLNLPEGLLKWDTTEMFPHNPLVVSTNRIPVKWDPDAKCPKIDRFLREVLPEDSIELAYEIAGYVLYNDNPLHKAIMLYGAGRNGKGTLLKIIRQLVGHNNISATTPQALDSSPFAAAELYGKLANLVGDVDPRIFRSTERFKQLTGGDYVQAERKHKDPFVYKCRALMIAGFNALPRSADHTEGFFSRWVVLPFINTFPAGRADPNLADKLTTAEELQGLLVQAVKGLQRLMERRSFLVPTSVLQATHQFRVEADPVRGFADAYLSTEDMHHFTPRSEIYETYTTWALANGHRPLSAGRFYTQLRSILEPTPTDAKREGQRGFIGVTCKDRDA